MSRRRQPDSLPAVRVPWHRRPAVWLRAWRARTEQRKRAHDRAMQVRAWLHRADAGEDICIGCGGDLQRLHVSPHSVTFRDRCGRCVGDNPVVSVDLARYTVCGRTDPTRTITAPVEMDRRKRRELAALVAGVCPDCATRRATERAGA